MPAITSKRLLKVQEAAEYTSMSKHTLNCLRVKGGGPKFVKLGSSVRYDPSDLELWIKSNKISHTSEHDARVMLKAERDWVEQS